MSGRFAMWIVAAAVLLASSGCSSSADSSDRAAQIARFEATLDSLRQAHQIPGLSVAVLRDQEVLLARGFGFADLEQSIGATENTVYRIASMSKTIAGTVAMKLVEQRVLALDEPMTETPDYAEFCQDFKTQSGSIFAKHYTCDTEALTLRNHLSHTVEGPAGERFSYNPVAFSWTSRTMAFRAGKPFSDLVAELIFEPVGMVSSARTHRALPLPPDLAARLAPPYTLDENGELVRAPMPPPQGDGAAGGIVSTVVDIARFDVALDRDEIIDADSRRQMHAPTLAPSGATLPYGIGWFVQDLEGLKLVWHSGWWEKAYSSLYLKIPEQRLTLILLANSEGVWWSNPPTSAEVEKSPFAAAFMAEFIH